MSHNRASVQHRHTNAVTAPAASSASSPAAACAEAFFSLQGKIQIYQCASCRRILGDSTALIATLPQEDNNTEATRLVLDVGSAANLVCEASHRENWRTASSSSSSSSRHHPHAPSHHIAHELSPIDDSLEATLGCHYSLLSCACSAVVGRIWRLVPETHLAHAGKVMLDVSAVLIEHIVGEGKAFESQQKEVLMRREQQLQQQEDSSSSSLSLTHETLLESVMKLYLSQQDVLAKHQLELTALRTEMQSIYHWAEQETTEQQHAITPVGAAVTPAPITNSTTPLQQPRSHHAAASSSSSAAAAASVSASKRKHPDFPYATTPTRNNTKSASAQPTASSANKRKSTSTAASSVPPSSSSVPRTGISSMFGPILSTATISSSLARLNSPSTNRPTAAAASSSSRHFELNRDGEDLGKVDENMADEKDEDDEEYAEQRSSKKRKTQGKNSDR